MLRQYLCIFSSLKLTLVLLLFLSVGVWWGYQNIGKATWAIAPPMLLLSFNLIAAIFCNATFRRQQPLLMFHLSLLAIIVLASLSRLTYLKGAAEVSEGGEFTGELLQYEAGPWHPWRLDKVRFINHEFEIHYAPGPRRTFTRNRVSWKDDSGKQHTKLIGDKQPLVLEGYRFYTTPNKGFAPIFSWQAKGEEPILGDLHLPSYPANRYRQSIEWTPPGMNQVIWVKLDFDEVILDPENTSVFRTPTLSRLIVRTDNNRYVLDKGQAIKLQGGKLVYHGLQGWMGYSVFYDPMLPWLLAACLMAVASMAYYYWNKFSGRKWNQQDI